MEKFNPLQIEKPKSIIVDGGLHNRFKMLCKGKSMKIGGVVENLMKLYIDNPKEVQKMIDEFKDKQHKFA